MDGRIRDQDRTATRDTDVTTALRDTPGLETMDMSPSVSVFPPSPLCPLKRLRPRQGEGLTDQDCGCHDRRPQTFLVADGGLRDVLRADDRVRQAVDLFLLVPAFVGFDFHAEGRVEHLGCELLGVVARDVFALAEAVVL